MLKNRRAVVTGSNSGIGEAIARRRAAEGAAVVVHGRKADAVGAVAASITADGGDAQGLAADLTDSAECDRFISEALADRVDIVVNTAGYINGANLRIDGGSTAVV